MNDETFLRDFSVVVNPIGGGQGVMVSMTATTFQRPDVRYYAPVAQWKNHYTQLFQRSGGLAPDTIAKLTGELESGLVVGLNVMCLLRQLEQIGFKEVRK